jgi:hypothetical protein
MDIPKRPWSTEDFIQVLTEQAFLARANQNSSRWMWKSDAMREEWILDDGFWMHPLVPAAIEGLLDECDTKSRRVIWHTSILGRYDMENICGLIERHAPTFQSWFVGWAFGAVTTALCFSPVFREPFEINLRGRTYRFAHHNGNAWFERLTDMPGDVHKVMNYTERASA